MHNRVEATVGGAVMVTNADDRVVFINPAFTELTGYTQVDLLHTRASELYVLPEISGKNGGINLDQLNPDGMWSGNINLKRIDGEVIAGLQTTVSMVLEDGGMRYHIHIIADSDHVSRRSGFDQATGLPGRSMFKEILAKELANAKRKRFQLGMLFIDIDNFKVINESLGYGKADMLLAKVAIRLKEQIRGNDLIASLGGNQFGVLLNDLAHAEDATIVIQKLMDSLAEGIPFENREMILTISSGIVIFPGDGEDSETLLLNAEQAMYQAKKDGRNAYHFFKASIQNSAINRLHLEQELRQAIDHEEFVVFYQPQIETSTGRVIGMEALIRWIHPERGMVPPFHFIPVAEETGMIVPIGEWVLNEACRQTKIWHDMGLTGLKVAVNISGRQFSDRQLLNKIKLALEKSGLNHAFLDIEITESVIMKDIEGTIAVLEKLSEMGLTLSIDDFGTGYSSLSYLKRFPIDKLKIDKSFIDDVITSSDDARIVEAIIGLSHNLNLNVICEGVEDAQQYSWLQERRCNAIQGFYFSKPLPADEFEAFVRDRNHIF